MNRPCRVWLLFACLVAWAAAPARAIDPLPRPTEAEARQALARLAAADDPRGAVLRRLPVVLTAADWQRLRGDAWFCDLARRTFAAYASWDERGMRIHETVQGVFERSANGTWYARETGGQSVFLRPGPP